MLVETRASLKNVYVTAGVASVFAVSYTLLNTEPAPLVAAFINYAPAVAVALWFLRDIRGTDLASVNDWGLFLVIAWPVLIPWYSFKKHGRRGWRLVALLVTLIFAPVLCALAVGLLWWLGEWMVYFVRSGA